MVAEKYNAMIRRSARRCSFPKNTACSSKTKSEMHFWRNVEDCVSKKTDSKCKHSACYWGYFHSMYEGSMKKKQTLKRIQCFTISKGTFHCKKIQRTSIRLTSMFIKVWESSLHPEKNRKELISKRFSNSKELLCYNFWLIEVANPLFFTRLFLNSSGEQRLPYKHLFLLPLTFFILSNYCSSYSFLHD